MRPYVRAANVTWSGWDLSDVKEMNFDPSDFEKYRLVPGDVLVNEGSGSAKEVGKPAIWRGEIPDCCFQNTLIRVQPTACSSEYLYYFFLHMAQSEGFVAATQGVNIHHIGRNGLASFAIPVPPFAEQQRIVARIEALFARVRRARAFYDAHLKILRPIAVPGRLNSAFVFFRRLRLAQRGQHRQPQPQPGEARAPEGRRQAQAR